MKRITTLLSAGFLVLSAGAVSAQDEGASDSMAELLQRIEQGQARDSQEARQREADFARRRNEQQNLLNQARTERNRQERESARLEQLFEDQQAQIVAARAALDERLGALKELFGVLQTVSGDTQGRFNNSLTNIQFPDREEFLVELGGKMAGASTLASIEDIEQLWFLLQQEVVESGKISRFNTTVTRANGEEQPMDIVRVGTFNLVFEDGYLQYDPGTQRVSELQRQPEQGRYTSSASTMTSATTSPVTFGIDITRGGILALLVESPTIQDRINQGGIVGYCIIGLGIIGLLIAIVRFIGLSTASRKVAAQLKREQASTDNPLGRVMAAYESNKDADTETIELKLSEAALKEMPGLTKGLLVHQGNLRRGAAHGSARYGYRYDQDLPGHHAVRRGRSEDDGRRYLAGPHDDGTRPRRGHPDGTAAHDRQRSEPQGHQHPPVAGCRARGPAFRGPLTGEADALAN